MPGTLLPCEFGGGRLRRLRPSDLYVFQAYRSLPELGRYQGWSPMSDAQALEFIDEMAQVPLFAPGEWVQLAIAESATDELVGDVGLYLAADGQLGEVGFTLQPSAQGRGLATRAVHEAVRLLFAATNTACVQGVTDARNVRSIRLLERLAFTYLRTRWVDFRGQPCAEMVYALARSAHR